MPNNKAAVKAKLAKSRLKEIRKFVDFDYDLRKPLTPYAQRKIKKYHDEIKALTNRPYQVYRPRIKGRRLQVQEFAQHQSRLSELKVAFIPTDGTNRVQIKFTQHGIVAKTAHVQWQLIPLSKRGLLKDAISEVEKRIKGRKEKQFTIAAGEYEIPQPYLKASLPAAVARLVMKYGEASGLQEDRDDGKHNHHWSRWLKAVRAYTFDNQTGIQEYLIEKQKNIKAGKRKRLAEKKRRQRARAKIQ